MRSVGHGIGNSVRQSVSATQRKSHLLWNPAVYNHFLKQVNPVHTVIFFPLWPILTPSFHLCLVLQKDICQSIFWPRRWVPVLCPTCPPHLIPSMIIRAMSGEEYKLWSSQCNVVSLTCPKIINILFSVTFILFFVYFARQVSHYYQTTNKIIGFLYFILYIFGWSIVCLLYNIDRWEGSQTRLVSYIKDVYSKIWSKTTCFGLIWPSSGFFSPLRFHYINCVKRVAMCRSPIRL